MNSIPHISRLFARPLLAATCVLAAFMLTASPASAGKQIDRYTGVLKLNLFHDRTGVDTSITDVYWARSTLLSATVLTVADEVEFVNRKSGNRAELMPRAVTDTFVDDLISVDGETAHCTNTGHGRAAPGEITFRSVKRNGRDAIEATIFPFNAFQVNASCTGFSNASGIFDFSKTPPRAKVVIPSASIGDETIELPVKGNADCPVTAQTEPTVTCSSTFDGNLKLELKGDQPDVTPGPTGDPKVDMVIALINRQLSKGTVKVRCSTACKGKVSAYAVAKEREKKGLIKPRLIGTGSVRSPKAGIVKTAIRFDRGDRSLLRKRGALLLEVKVKPRGGSVQTLSQKVRVGGTRSAAGHP